jgi:A/G-specific adenine glycosylase
LKVLGIAPDVVQWQRLHGRHELPWQAAVAGDGSSAQAPDPYRIWLSEVMLQQTQVATVIPYFKAFIAAFPTVADLAAATPDQVMALWSGLGYYSRARNLHAAARRVVERHGGDFPSTAEDLATLPGVGQSTAAAIAAFAFGERAAILDGNVKRVFCRVFAIEGSPTQSNVMRELWLHAQAELPLADDIRSYTQGLMDLGATLCTRAKPACDRCPLAAKCIARRENAVARLPSPRPRREVPVREVDMLLLCNGGSVLIEQRPPAGIWGGLWSLPEIRSPQDHDPMATSGCDRAPLRPERFARFEHVFTHFRMKASVWRADLDAVQAASVLRQAPPTRWLALAEAGSAPLPRPVKSLLQSLADGPTLPGLD